MYDDISSAPKSEPERRRGAPGTFFIYKIVGALAEEGADLAQLRQLGERVRDNTRTLGAALGPGTSPLTGEPMFAIGADEMFIGTGVHGESGARRTPFTGADRVVTEMVEAILADRSFAGEEVLVFVNGAGGTTLMELLIVYRAVEQTLRQHGVRPYRPLVDRLVTTQEMAGFSISLCSVDDQLKRLWNAAVDTPYYAHPKRYDLG